MKVNVSAVCLTSGAFHHSRVQVRLRQVAQTDESRSLPATGQDELGGMRQFPAKLSPSSGLSPLLPWPTASKTLRLNPKGAVPSYYCEIRTSP